MSLPTIRAATFLRLCLSSRLTLRALPAAQELADEKDRSEKAAKQAAADAAAKVTDAASKLSALEKVRAVGGWFRSDSLVSLFRRSACVSS